MNPARLNQRITIQKNEVRRDSIGNYESLWSPYFIGWAAVDERTGREAERLGIVAAETDLIFTVRYCRETVLINTTNYRILFAGGIYNITYIDHLNYNRKMLKFYSQKVQK